MSRVPANYLPFLAQLEITEDSTYVDNPATSDECSYVFNMYGKPLPIDRILRAAYNVFLRDATIESLPELLRRFPKAVELVEGVLPHRLDDLKNSRHLLCFVFQANWDKFQLHRAFIMHCNDGDALYALALLDLRNQMEKWLYAPAAPPYSSVRNPHVTAEHYLFAANHQLIVGPLTENESQKIQMHTTHHEFLHLITQLKTNA